MRKLCGLRRPARLASLAWVVVLVATSQGRGELMTYQYGGLITSAAVSTGVAAGARFEGTFAYDLVAGPTACTNLTNGRSYEFGTVFASPATTSATGLASSVGGQQILQSWGELSLDVYGPGAFGDGPGTPQTYLSLGASDSFGAGAISVQLLFLNTVRVVYPTLDAPSSIDLADFTTARFEVVQNLGRAGFQTLYEGVIDGLALDVSPAIVPEPSSLLLLGTAAGAYLLRGRRRRGAGERPPG